MVSCYDVRCTCNRLPSLVQQRSRATIHISAFSDDFPDDSGILHAHMEDQVAPPWTTFLHQNTLALEQVLIRWKLPSSLIQYRQHFLRTVWTSSVGTWRHSKVARSSALLNKFVTSPVDHFPHSLTIHCPQHWHDLVCRTFLDPNAFTPCTSTPVRTSQQIRESVPEWLSRTYAWSLDFFASLSQGYILPKTSRQLAKARPIIKYSSAWPQKLGQALGIALLEILQVVYKDLLQYKDASQDMTEIHKLLTFADSHDLEYDVLQSDIAGFYNQVAHDRILQAVQFAVHQFCLLQGVTLDTCIQTHTHKMERTLRIFRGNWRSQTKQYRELRLGDLTHLVKFLLDNSFFHVGAQVFRQHRGASMGSQWAPVLCSAVALMPEHTFSMIYPQLMLQPYFSHRYVDNRLLIVPTNSMHRRALQLFWKLHFYTAFNSVGGFDALGFIVDPVQGTVTHQNNRGIRLFQAVTVLARPVH